MNVNFSTEPLLLIVVIYMKMESVVMHIFYHNDQNITHDHKDKVDTKNEDNLGSEWWKVFDSFGKLCSLVDSQIRQ